MTRKTATIGELQVFTQDLKEFFNAQFKNSDSKFDDFKNSVNKNFEEVKDNQKSTNGRVKKLEIWRSFVVGFVLALNVIVYPALGYLLVRYFDVHLATH